MKSNRYEIEETEKKIECWGREKAGKLLKLIVHIATVVFGTVTGEGDDMICSRSKSVQSQSKRVMLYEPPKQRRENPASQ